MRIREFPYIDVINNGFSVRNFLKARNALLIHFSTTMSRHNSEFLFPADLHNAIKLTEVPLSFSTILPTDRGPYDRHSVNIPAHANAYGSVGIVVDIGDDGCVETVNHRDSGTNQVDASGAVQSDGELPSQAACERSLDLRSGTNEWVVRNYQTVGIFVFRPPYVMAETILEDPALLRFNQN
jgi:hypothetical protein